MSSYQYRLLNTSDRHELMRQRLHRIEVDHYSLTLELRLAGVIEAAEEHDIETRFRLAALETQAVALTEWLNVKEPPDA